jgi:hypothetical protein
MIGATLRATFAQKHILLFPIFPLSVWYCDNFGAVYFEFKIIVKEL